MARLVRITAVSILAKLPGNSGIELSDLIQAGNVGLIQARRSYSPDSGTQLAGYAKFRIRGEMLDSIRRHSSRSRTKIIVRGSTADDGRDLESTIPAPPSENPHVILAKNQREAIIGEEIERLPPAHRAVVRLHYSRDYSLREIGARLNVHESRACQLHRSALGRLKRALARRGVRSISGLL